MHEQRPVRGRRRGPAWVRVSHGVHRPAEADPRTALDAWQLVLPLSGRFTHLTAAGIYEWWLPPLPDGLPVFTAQSDADSRPQRPGLVAFRHADPETPNLLEDLRVDPPEQVLLSCARHLSVVDLVVLVDAALHSGVTTTEALATAARPRRRGAPMLRKALGLADGRSESAWETLLRLLHGACGIEVEPQHRLRDESGTEVARADLWLVGTNALHEYDGGEHLKRRRQRSDLARGRRIGNVQWVRRGYTSVEVLHQAVGILRDADLSLGREHDPARVRQWHALLAESLFTPSGQVQFLHRLGPEDRGEACNDGTGGERHPNSA
ncbi:MAG TPA: hypothetical protein VFG72_07310 [Marmoricola sp.]|nr:hypothetical protein [Marmoricola sp.]